MYLSATRVFETHVQATHDCDRISYRKLFVRRGKFIPSMCVLLLMLLPCRLSRPFVLECLTSFANELA